MEVLRIWVVRSISPSVCPPEIILDLYFGHVGFTPWFWKRSKQREKVAARSKVRTRFNLLAWQNRKFVIQRCYVHLYTRNAKISRPSPIPTVCASIWNYRVKVTGRSNVKNRSFFLFNVFLFFLQAYKFVARSTGCRLQNPSDIVGIQFHLVFIYNVIILFYKCFFFFFKKKNSWFSVLKKTFPYLTP